MGKKLVVSPKARSLGEAKLLSSGIDASQAKQLGIEYLDAQGTVRHHKAFKPVCSLKLSYHDHLGEPLSGWPKAPPFYRLRYLETPADFASLTKEKPIRYVQAPGSAPVAYYPLNHDWEQLVKDPSQPLIITEGELKAIKACQEGFPTVGLGGVYNWRSHKLGLEWLPSLDPIDWVSRNVYICFDADYKTNFMVCMALKEFAEELHRRGAFAHLVSLPAVPNVEKTGLDDYLIANSAESFRKLLHEAEPLGLTRVLFSYNERFVYARDPGLVIDQKSHQKLAPPAFKDHAQSVARYQEREIERDGSVSHKAVPAAGAWLKWPLRHEVAKLTYAPGHPPLHEDTFNTWRGWGVEPTKGDVKPFLKLVDHLFTGADEGAKEWFLRWCAYPLQYPGTKMFSCVLLHGRRHGTGKSFIGYTLGRIYGENFAEIDQQDLQNNDNDWAENKQFVLADDITGSNKRHDADILKKKITQRSIRINVKYVPRYSIPDCINWYFTANQADTFFLEDDDRRNFIHEVLVGPLDEAFYKDYELWLDTGGAAAVFHHLLKLDLGDFNPSGHAFMTAAKSRMTAIVQSDLAGWVRELLTNPEHVLKVGSVPLPHDLVTSRQLLELYDPIGRTGTTANGIARELARAGIQQVAKGMPLRLPDGSQARYYAVRNADRWLTCDAKACVEHLTQAASPVKKKKY
jgi:hypothetical protein